MIRLKIIPSTNSENELESIRKKISLMKIPEMKGKYKLSKIINAQLDNEFQIVLKYLLAKDVHCRIPLYVLFSDKIKIETSDNYYVWKEESCLWEQKEIEREDREYERTLRRHERAERLERSRK